MFNADSLFHLRRGWIMNGFLSSVLKNDNIAAVERLQKAADAIRKGRSLWSDVNKEIRGSTFSKTFLFATRRLLLEQLVMVSDRKSFEGNGCGCLNLVFDRHERRQSTETIGSLLTRSRRRQSRSTVKWRVHERTFRTQSCESWVQRSYSHSISTLSERL